MSEDLLSLADAPRFMPADWTPPVPAFAGRFDEQIETISVAYVGAQQRGGALSPPPGLDGSHAPQWLDHARFQDGDDCENRVWIGYWTDPARMARWLTDSTFAQWWAAPERVAGPHGYWLEATTAPISRFETLVSSADGAQGACRLARDLIGPIREHNYWGAMQDRILASATDPLASPLPAAPAPAERNTLGKRVSVRAPDHLCLIRSAQDLRACDPDQRRRYEERIEPRLPEGLSYLQREPTETGCVSSRYMRDVAADGEALDRTFGSALFLSAQHLADWAKHHPT
ncbi:MAG: phenylacetaldoxime dehydratase family protein, partial [Caulobacterales bacterium]|nr:phenylacetaldoxime dehydratase family protein [Caulobacterales bacterium]